MLLFQEAVNRCSHNASKLGMCSMYMYLISNQHLAFDPFEQYMHFHKNTDVMKILNFTDSCGIVCEIKEENNGNSNNFDIFIVIDNKTFQYPVSPSKKTQNITFQINTAGCCSKSLFPHLHILKKKYVCPVCS